MLLMLCEVQCSKLIVCAHFQPGMWKYIGIQIGYALSGKFSPHTSLQHLIVDHTIHYTAWIIYTVIAMVIGLAIALIYICLILFTDWVISITLALL